MIKAAVVGLGRIGALFETGPLRGEAATHAGGWHLQPEAQLVAGVDPDVQRRTSFENYFGVPAFPTWSAMIGEVQPNIVSISTLPDLHAELVRLALDAGAQRIICEKPCTPDLASCRALLEDLGEEAQKVGVNFTRRYDPLHRRLFDECLKEPIRGGIGHYTGGITNTGSHWLDGLHSAGGRVHRVLARPNVVGDDPTPNVLLELRDGANVYLQGHDVTDYTIFETDLYTRSRRIRLVQAGLRGELYERQPSSSFSGYFELQKGHGPLPDGLSRMMLSVVTDAIASLKEGRDMLCTIRDAALVHRVIDAVKKSLTAGDWVVVTDESD